jgi:hypothetical protein
MVGVFPPPVLSIIRLAISIKRREAVKRRMFYNAYIMLYNDHRYPSRRPGAVAASR